MNFLDARFTRNVHEQSRYGIYHQLFLSVFSFTCHEQVRGGIARRGRDQKQGIGKTILVIGECFCLYQWFCKTDAQLRTVFGICGFANVWFRLDATNTSSAAAAFVSFRTPTIIVPASLLSPLPFHFSPSAIQTHIIIHSSLQELRQIWQERRTQLRERVLISKLNNRNNRRMYVFVVC